MKRIILFTFCIFLTAVTSQAQKKVKYGKIDKADLSMTQYPLDSSAHAAFLFDQGYTELVYDKLKREFIVKFERHFRIKIFDKSGADWANFNISLYNDSKDREKLHKFKGTTYTLINGKVEETSVGRGDLLTEKLSENRTLSKIAMPKIQEGSIIEIRYSTTSPFHWNLQDWQFQYEIPVRYSEYRVNYPEWFQYKTNFKGYELQHVTPLNLQSDTRTVQATNISYRRMRDGWVAKEMPALIEEAYTTNINNFLVKVDFELGGTKFPDSPWKSYTQTWEDIAKTLRQADFFGKQYTKGKLKSFASEAKAAMATATTETEKIAAIYYNLKSKMAWDGRTSIGAMKTIKSAWLARKGTSGDINLTLLAMLKSAGFQADPVLLSTRKNGFLNPYFPNLSQFNYSIVQVSLADGKKILLDATAEGLPINLLPDRCINDQGLVISDTGIEWIDVLPSGKFNKSRALSLKLNEDMEWEGEMKMRCKDYAANYLRSLYSSKENESAYIESMESDYEGLDVSDFSMKGLKDIGKSVDEKCQVNINNQIMDGGDLLYFNPMLDFGYEENPFKLEKRSYPIDFIYPRSSIYSALYEIPEGFVIDELPEAKVITLPEKTGFFSYSAKLQGGKIMILSQLKINKRLFLPQEYDALKEFYKQVVEKHSEQVVLKKG